ncbi:hypothetical protein DFH06DRAFT_90554 [Mycena polygramma]|nr:hypothetical protein DFH06DRAFT_90554 [Mycena polygramma]
MNHTLLPIHCNPLVQDTNLRAQEQEKKRAQNLTEELKRKPKKQKKEEEKLPLSDRTNLPFLPSSTTVDLNIASSSSLTAASVPHSPSVSLSPKSCTVRVYLILTFTTTWRIVHRRGVAAEEGRFTKRRPSVVVRIFPEFSGLFSSLYSKMPCVQAQHRQQSAVRPRRQRLMEVRIAMSRKRLQAVGPLSGPPPLRLRLDPRPSSNSTCLRGIRQRLPLRLHPRL